MTKEALGLAKFVPARQFGSILALRPCTIGACLDSEHSIGHYIRRRCDCRPHHRVDIEPSPPFASAKREFSKNRAETFRQNSKFRRESGIAEITEWRKGPYLAGFFANFADQNTETGLAGWRPSAVSTLLRLFSLLTGNFTGNFAKIAALGTGETIESAVITGLPMRIPYSTEQGIIFADQGILAREQEILSARIEIIVRHDFGTKAL